MSAGCNFAWENKVHMNLWSMEDFVYKWFAQTERLK